MSARKKIGLARMSAAGAGLFLFSLILVEIQSAYSQNGAGSKKTNAEVSADSLQDSQTSAGPILTLSGHAKIISDGNTTMVTDLALYNRTTQVARSPGRIQIDDPQNTIIGDTGLAYYKTRDAKISGNVHITIRPKPDAAKASEGSARHEFKNPVYITCDNVDYNWHTRVAVATGHLIMKSETRTITAEKATYFGREEKVVLDGKVHYTNVNGDHGDTPEATAILTEGHEQFSTKKVAATISIDNDEVDTTAPAANTTATKPAAKPSPAANPPAAVPAAQSNPTTGPLPDAGAVPPTPPAK